MEMRARTAVVQQGDTGTATRGDEVPAFRPDDPTDVMVMFLRRRFMAHESEGAVLIEVIRIGDTTERTTVLMSTRNLAHHGSVASAGSEDYIPIEKQQLVFEPGVTMQSVKIELVNNDR